MACARLPAHLGAKQAAAAGAMARPLARLLQPHLRLRVRMKKRKCSHLWQGLAGTGHTSSRLPLRYCTLLPKFLMHFDRQHRRACACLCEGCNLSNVPLSRLRGGSPAS